MKSAVCMIACLLTCLSCQGLKFKERPPFTVKITPHWVDFSTPKMSALEEHWVLVSVVSLRKTIKGQIQLKNFDLNWHGEPLDYMLGSLFKGAPGKPFMPIDKFIVTDSIWNKSNQTMNFHFDQPLTLDALTELYLVLTIPDESLESITSGHFSINTDSLPAEVTAGIDENEIKTALLITP